MACDVSGCNERELAEWGATSALALCDLFGEPLKPTFKMCIRHYAEFTLSWGQFLSTCKLPMHEWWSEFRRAILDGRVLRLRNRRIVVEVQL